MNNNPLTYSKNMLGGMIPSKKPSKAKAQSLSAFKKTKKNNADVKDPIYPKKGLNTKPGMTTPPRAFFNKFAGM